MRGFFCSARGGRADFHAYMKDEISMKVGNEFSRFVIYYSSKSIEAVSPISSKETEEMIADRARAMMAAGKVIPELQMTLRALGRRTYWRCSDMSM